MAKYPTKQIAPYQGPGWYQTPPAAGAFVPGAGAQHLQVSKDLTNLAASISGVGALAAEDRVDDELAEANRVLLKEGEAKFRELEKTGHIDWTPTMARGAAELRAMLNAQDVMTQFQGVMKTATLEQMSDPEFPTQEYSKLIDARNASVEPNDYADNVFFEYAVNPGSKGRDMVDYYTAESAKIAKEQGIVTMGVAASNWVTDTWQQFKDMDAEDPNYTDVRDQLFSETKDWLQTFISGDGDSPGARGWGFYTANNGEGAKTLFTSILDGLMTQGVSPADATEFMKTIKVGAHDMAGVAPIKKMLAEWEADLPVVQGAWEKRKRANFWNALDVSIKNEPLRFAEEHQHRMMSKGEARDELYDWYTNQKRRLHNHFGLLDSGDDHDWQSSEQELYNAYAQNIENAYQTFLTRIRTQEQVNQTVDPTMEEVTLLADAALKAAQDVGTGYLYGVRPGDANFPKGHPGVVAGGMAAGGNYETLTQSSVNILALLVDPESCTLEDPDGKPFGPKGAKEFLDRLVFDNLYKPTIGNIGAWGEMIILLGGQNATQQGLIGQSIRIQMERFIGLGSQTRAGQGLTERHLVGMGIDPTAIGPDDPYQIGGDPWDPSIDPRTRTLGTAFDELPKDAGEISREDLENSDILASFEVYEYVRNKSKMAATFMGIAETEGAAVFESAFNLQGNGAPAAARLAEAFTRHRLAGRPQIGGGPMTGSARTAFEGVLEGMGIGRLSFEIAASGLQSAWDRRPLNMSKQDEAEWVKEWAKANVARGEDDDDNTVFVRYGPPEDFYQEQVSEELFLGVFKRRLDSIVGTDPSRRIQLTVLHTPGGTQVIPHAVNVKTGQISDLFDHKIKAVYSRDDLKYMYEAVVAWKNYIGYAEKHGKAPAPPKQLPDMTLGTIGGAPQWTPEGITALYPAGIPGLDHTQMALNRLVESHTASGYANVPFKESVSTRQELYKEHIGAADPEGLSGGRSGDIGKRKDVDELLRRKLDTMPDEVRRDFINRLGKLGGRADQLISSGQDVAKRKVDLEFATEMKAWEATVTPDKPEGAYAEPRYPRSTETAHKLTTGPGKRLGSNYRLAEMKAKVMEDYYTVVGEVLNYEETTEEPTDPLLQEAKEITKRSQEDREKREAEALKILAQRMQAHNIQAGSGVRDYDTWRYFEGIDAKHIIESVDELTMVDGIYDPESAVVNSNYLMSRNPGITETPEEYGERIKLLNELELEGEQEEITELSAEIAAEDTSLQETAAMLDNLTADVEKRKLAQAEYEKNLKQEDPERYSQYMIDITSSAILRAWTTPDNKVKKFFMDQAVTTFFNLSEEERTEFLDIADIGEFWNLEVADLNPHMSGQLSTFRDQFILAIHRRKQKEPEKFDVISWEDYHGKYGKPDTESAAEMRRVYGDAVSQGASPVQGLAALRDHVEHVSRPTGALSEADAERMKVRWHDWILHLERKLDPDRTKRLRGRERGPDGK